MLDRGDKLGGYEIVAPLRAGGMATLFLARRTGAAGFSRMVAIKLVHPHLATDRTFVSMLVDEALLAVRVRHPNVVHIEELGEAEIGHYIVMEHVHGVSLALLLDRLATSGRRMGPELAVHLAVQVADGLHTAHDTRGDDGARLELVHRDVSPSNVMIARTGHVKLIDFGIAKAKGRAVQTSGGAIKGTFRYMSPEQAAGGIVDRRSDVFSLGIVLWEMLTGRRLYDGTEEVEILLQARDPEIVAPSTLVGSLPPELDRAVMAALASRVTERPQTARELRRMLVDAVPEAARLDAEDVAALLEDVVGDALDSDLAALPEEASRVVADASRTTRALAARERWTLPTRT